MTEATSPPHTSNNKITSGITLQDHHGGDDDKKEMVKLKVDGGVDLSLLEARFSDGDEDKKEMVKLKVDGGVDLSLLEARFSDGVYDKPLTYFGCGIGWFSFLLGFAFPPLWYYATVLYFGDCLKDPRERPGLAASAIAALICSVIIVVALLVVFCRI